MIQGYEDLTKQEQDTINKYRYKYHITISPTMKSFGKIRPGSINWAALGEQSASKTIAYAKKLISASKMLKQLDKKYK